MKARAISSLCFGVFVIDTTVIFFSICAKSNIFLTSFFFWINSSIQTSFFKIEIKKNQSLKFAKKIFIIQRKHF